MELKKTSIRGGYIILSSIEEALNAIAEDIGDIIQEKDTLKAKLKTSSHEKVISPELQDKYQQVHDILKEATGK